MPIIRVKDSSVCIAHLDASLWFVINNYHWLRAKYDVTTDTVITSGNDGKHSRLSKHHDNAAVDCRTKDVTPSKMRRILTELKRACGIDFDIVWEHRGKPNEHLHIERHPKQR